jgi:protein CWC15
MTTAHRPTWKAAVGQANEGGWSAGGAVSHQTSALDAPAHTKLKFRSDVDKTKALEKSLLALEEAEVSAKTLSRQIAARRRPVDQAVEERAQQRLQKQTAEIDVEKIKKKYDDSDVDDGGGSDDSSASDLDADDDSDLNSDDDSDDEEDEEAALQAELAKIRAEREEAKRKAEAKEAELEESKNAEAAVLGNPLLAASNEDASSSRMKRRWNDDVVFRNQAKSEPAPKKRFINDTVRNDFHKRFLNKFIR